MSAYKKGARRERELLSELDVYGYVGLRAPSSGGATQRELPDVLVGKDGHSIAIELKSSSGDPIYIKRREVEDLKYFAKNFGADARIAARFDRCDFWFFDPSDLYQTPAGNYRIKKDISDEKKDKIEDICR